MTTIDLGQPLLTPPAHSNADEQSTTRAYSHPLPAYSAQPNSYMNTTASSPDPDFPGAFPREPLDRLANDSVEPSASFGAARKRAVEVAQQYLPESVVGAFGSALPVGTTNLKEADKKLNPEIASHSNLASNEKIGGSKSTNDGTTVAGTATELDPSTHTHAPISGSSPLPQPSSNPDSADSKNTPEHFTEAIAPGLANIYAPVNIASESSINSPAVSPSSFPPPSSNEETREHKASTGAPPFIATAPAPGHTGSTSPLNPTSGDETPSATKQFRNPSISAALDSTTPHVTNDVSEGTSASSDPVKDKESAVAAAGLAAGTGYGGTKAASKEPSTAESKGKSPESGTGFTTVPVRRTDDAPDTPPTAFGTGAASRDASSFKPAKSGANSDFPLPSGNSSLTDGINALRLSGDGRAGNAGRELNTSTAVNNDFPLPSTGTDKTARTSNNEKDTATEKGQSHYHGTEGLQEKYGGGALQSNTSNENENDGDGEIAHGEKKEGRVKHFVEKVKDKLHHH